MAKHLLLIGGTDTNRALLKAALEEHGYRVSAAVTRRYTNHWLSRRIKPFDLIIYDVDQAEQDAEFWPELRQSANGSRIMVIASVFDQSNYQAVGMDRVLRRPVAIGDIIKESDLLLA
jgi:CheY-like chemotaxis protein